MSHADRHSARITVDELQNIHPGTLIAAAVAIPRDAISAALKSPEAELASIEKYMNNSAVEGIWSEFHHGGNWYMISLSQVEVPARPTRSELERMTDEFLSQQARGTRRPAWRIDGRSRDRR